MATHRILMSSKLPVINADKLAGPSSQDEQVPKDRHGSNGAPITDGTPAQDARVPHNKQDGSQLANHPLFSTSKQVIPKPSGTCYTQHVYFSEFIDRFNSQPNDLIPPTSISTPHALYTDSSYICSPTSKEAPGDVSFMRGGGEDGAAYNSTGKPQSILKGDTYIHTPIQTDSNTNSYIAEGFVNDSANTNWNDYHVHGSCINECGDSVDIETNPVHMHKSMNSLNYNISPYHTLTFDIRDSQNKLLYNCDADLAHALLSYDDLDPFWIPYLLYLINMYDEHLLFDAIQSTTKSDWLLDTNPSVPIGL